MNDQRLILNLLLDRFERSKHLRSPGQSHRAVFLRYDRATLPDYWNEQSGQRRIDLNAATERLAGRGLLTIRRSGYSASEIERVDLDLNRVAEAYLAADRSPRRQQELQLADIAQTWLAHWPDAADWRRRFAMAVAEAAATGARFPVGLRHDEAPVLDDLCRVFDAVGPTGLPSEVPRRVFSQRVLGHSKRLEGMLGRLLRCLREFWPAILPDDDGDALSELGIVENPRFVYLAGPVVFDGLDIGRAGTAIGLPTGFLQRCQQVTTQARQVITVENLTSFHQVVAELPQRTVAVYLGGYHNRVRRELLAKLAGAGIERFYHWGDIDLGGFRIFVHLAEKTGLPMQPLLMDLGTYRQYAQQGTLFTESYARSLAGLLEQPAFARFAPVVREMLKAQRGVEQEAVVFEPPPPGPVAISGL